MVNLKEFLITGTTSEASLLKNAETIIRYVRKSESEFIKKTLKACNDILLDKNVAVINKYFTLQLVNICLLLKNNVFIETFFDELNRTLIDFISINRTSEMNPNLKGKHIFKFLNQNANENDSEMFYELLLECIEFWGSQLNKLYPFFIENIEIAKSTGIIFKTDSKYVLKYISLIDYKVELDKNQKKNEQPKLNSNNEIEKKLIKDKTSEVELDIWEAEMKENFQELKEFIDHKNEINDEFKKIIEKMNELIDQISHSKVNLSRSQKDFFEEGSLILKIYKNTENFQKLKDFILNILKKPQERSPSNFSDLESKKTKKSVHFEEESDRKNSIDNFLKLQNSKNDRKTVPIEKFPDFARLNTSPRFNNGDSFHESPIKNDNLMQKIYQFMNFERKEMSIEIETLKSENKTLKTNLSQAESEISYLQTQIKETINSNRKFETEIQSKSKIIEEFVNQISTFLKASRPLDRPIIANSNINSLSFSPNERLVKFEQSVMKDFTTSRNSKPITQTTEPLTDRPYFPTTDFKNDSNFYQKNEIVSKNAQSGKKEDIGFLKDTIKQNSDFMKSFNDDINNILNRDKSSGAKSSTYLGSKIQTITSSDNTDRNLMRNTETTFERTQFVEKKFPIQNERYNYKIHNSSIGDLKQKLGVDDKTNNFREKFVPETMNGAHDTVIDGKSKANVLKDHFFSNTQSNFLGDIMKYKKN